MLDRISDLVGTIVIIIVLATFLDLIVPEGSIKGYVKLFIGLLILLTILNPIVSLLDSELAYEPEMIFEAKSPVDTKRKTPEDIVARGKKLKEEDIKLIKERYELALREEITDLVDNNFSSYDLYQVKFSYNEKWGKPEFGDISEVKLKLKERKDKDNNAGELEKDNELIRIKEIKPVKLKLKNKTDEVGKKREESSENKTSEVVTLPEEKKENKRELIREISEKFYLSSGNIEIKAKEGR